ncbi:uncharacterized protein LOC122929254 [Bufo gargarizans]|uniref:uncharacterized protein LOC122923162 n=1 Tax=Bufo gargarizans TaxID=30331 RepID=UPI001CF3BC6F|nr:uncharacterized protein LOC122923162 [Bufo gargarizans]XP_044138707.1 uncharacterized protein LOC122929254 [Bufo gargarizans]
MVANKFLKAEEETLIIRLLERGYDDLRSHADKKVIINDLVDELRRVHKGSHTPMAILKKWSDLKRRHLQRIRQIRDAHCPGARLPSVRRRLDTKDSWEVSASEGEDEEQPGPSGPTSAPAPPHEEEEEAGLPAIQDSPPSAILEDTPEEEEDRDSLITTPHKQILKSFEKKMAAMDREYATLIRQSREQLSRKIRELRRQHSHQMAVLEKQHRENMEAIKLFHGQLDALP